LIAYRRIVRFSLLTLIVFALFHSAFADEIHLTGGKVIKGRITSEEGDLVKITTREYGEISFPGNIVEKIVRDETPGATKAETRAPAATPTPTPAKVNITRPVASRKEVLFGFDAVLFDVVKEVYIRPFGGEWIPAKSNIQLKVKDEVRTGLGKAKLTIRGRGEVRIPPNSHMILVAMDPRGEKITIELKGGRIWNNVTPGGGVVNYTIRTPDLVAGVRGTLFKVSLNEAPGSRVAVFEGSVIATIPGRETATPGVTVGANLAVFVDEKGQLSSPNPVDPEEIQEWTEWDEWALDIHENIASRFVFGGEQIDQMANVIAEDGKRYEQIVSEANRQIIINKEAARMEGYREAFMKFARDTGVFPPSGLGFSVLIENPGFPGWNGPYIGETTLPIMDRWKKPLRYFLKKSEKSGNEYGEIISGGPDGSYHEGGKGPDDLRVLVPFYEIALIDRSR